MELDFKTALLRLQSDDKQTLGSFLVFENEELVFDCKMLELPHKGNAISISRIMAARYLVEKGVRANGDACFHIRNVPNRTHIQVHSGNYYRDTEGCPLPGKTLTDINGDGYRDVTSSGDTMKELLKLLPNRFYLDIIDMDY